MTHENENLGTRIDQVKDLAALAIDLFERLNGLSHQEINIVLIRVQRLVSANSIVKLDAEQVEEIRKREMDVN